VSQAEYFFHQGTNIRAYEYMGAHRLEDGSVRFRVWAPNAHRIFLCGDFNNWCEDTPLERENISGIWSVTLKDFEENGRYKYAVYGNNGRRMKADPYAFYSETGMQTASMFHPLKDFDWTDEEFVKSRQIFASCRENDDMPSAPVNIYEVHLGSWKKKEDGSFYNYRELGDMLAEYVKEMGYTHVELMPVAEHPFEGSWGYQVCGYYSPTSRFGAPEDFMYLVNKLHLAGVGVILDWVPAHFPKDEHGLYEFDGSPLYEYSDPTRMENRGWGTRCFDVGRNEVRSFLISNACFWLEKYHIDGIRIDAVASMLYLDYDRDAGEWHPNAYGGNQNLEAISFFQHLNKVVYDNYPDRMMIAEESTAFPNVTKRHGLGFTFKWNMGWMNDTLSYLPVDPYFRSGSHGKMTFPMMYAFSENYVLPLSHDEVVHCKRSIIGKCSGDYWQQFATARAYYGYMMAHPGKKLNFMGNEIAQFAEWDYKGQIDWFLLDFEKHRQFKNYISKLNNLYIDTPALWDLDRDWGGFSWLYADARDQNMYIFSRTSKFGEKVYAIINFSACPHENVTFSVDKGGYYDLLLNSDSEEFGGSGYLKRKTLRGLKDGHGGYKITVSVPPLGALYIKKRSGQKK